MTEKTLPDIDCAETVAWLGRQADLSDDYEARILRQAAAALTSEREAREKAEADMNVYRDAADSANLAYQEEAKHAWAMRVQRDEWKNRASHIERETIERCAKVADGHGVFPFTSRDPDVINRQCGAEETAMEIAAAIRAMGEDKP